VTDLSIDAAVHGDGAETAEPVVSLRLVDGSEVRRPLRLAQAREVTAAVPWRATRSAKGQTHFPGFYWSATTGRHVIYVSRLELARLLLADFDPDVVAIRGRDRQGRRHRPVVVLTVPGRTLRQARRGQQVIAMYPLSRPRSGPDTNKPSERLRTWIRRDQRVA
jgi:hypothetical protein